MGSIGGPGTVPSPTSPMPATSSLQPTWHGYIADTREALILFEATIGGQLSRVVRRPHDRERASLIKSGSIFIYEESASGIKRWTDGVPWSPSRILNNFLIYRELEKPFPPGEKKRATKKTKKQIKSEEPQSALDGDDLDGNGSPTTPTLPGSAHSKTESNAEKDVERALVGSLTDSYAFKEGGLVKKTMSVNVDGVHYHLVSYYKPEDVTTGMLPKPTDTDLRNVRVRGELLHRQNFRTPLDEYDDSMQQQNQFGQPPRNQPFMAAHGFVQTPGFVQQHPMQAPTSPYYGGPPHFQMPPQNQPPQAYMGKPHPAMGMPPSPNSPIGYYNPMAQGHPMKNEFPQYSPYPDHRAFPADHYGQRAMDGWPPGPPQPPQ